MEVYGPYIAMAIGLIGLVMNIRAMVTGENPLARIGNSRAKAPRAFWLETGLLTGMSFGLVVLGMQIADWI
jgi:hypothetical protein